MAGGRRRWCAILAAASILLAGLPATAMAVEATPETTVTTTTPDAQDSQDSQGSKDSDAADATRDDADTGVATVAEGAPDVVIDDMLSTDVAYVSKLKLTDIVSGTAPWDKDDERGDDSSASNRIIRSFDTATYNYDVTVTPDDTMHYWRKARVGFRFELPYPSDYVTFDTDQMGWVDTTPGYEAKLTVENKGTDSEKTVYTCYRLLEPTSSSPTTLPGTFGMSLAVKVKGAPHGYEFTPTVSSWMAWNADDPTSTGTHRALTDTPDMLTVSAKLNLNLRLTGGISGYTPNQTYDFTSSDATALNADLGEQKGIVNYWSMGVDMRWADRSKGLKGLEIPSGPITFDIRMENRWSDEGSSTAHDPEEALQPYFWALGGVDGTKGAFTPSDRKLTKYGVNVRRDDYDYARAGQSGNGVDQTWGNGGWTVTQSRDKTGTTLHVTVSDYEVDADRLPYFAAGHTAQAKCSTKFMDSGCSQYEVAEISTSKIYMFNPTTVDGQDVAHYYATDVALNSTVTDSNVHATSVTGDTVATQSIDTDDTRAISSLLRLPGSFIQEINYSCPKWDNALRVGMDCGDYSTQDSTSGSDSTTAGSPVNIAAGFNYTVSKEDLPVMSVNLVAVDPKVIDTTKTVSLDFPNGRWWSQEQAAAGKAATLVYYAVKKDGKTWTGDDEMRTADVKDLDLYQSVDEARSHGVIVGYVLAARTAAATWNAGANLNTFFYSGILKLTARDDAPVGSVAQTTGVAYTWTRSQLHDKGITTLDPTGATDDEWEAWANTQSPLQIFDKLTPYFRYDGTKYVKAKYSEDGDYLGGETASRNRGDSLYIVGEQPHVGKTVDQTNEAGKPKSIYDIDKEQRYVDWNLAVSSTTGNNSTSGTYTTDYTVTDTLPKGLTYVDGSAYLDGTYTEHTPDRGSVSGGEKLTPKVTANKDGTTTLVWTVNGAKADGSVRHIHYSTTIGDASDPDTDVKNNDSFTNTVQIISKRNRTTPSKVKGTIADATIRVSRTHASSIATRANPLINDIESSLGFSNMLGNFSQDVKPDPFAVDVMPWMGDGSMSSYHGDYTLAGLTVAASNGASLKTARVFFTTDVKYRSMDAVKITRSEVMSWHEATLDRSTGKVTIPDGYDQPVAWGFVSDELPSNARYDFTIDITPTGNRSSDAYINRWADGDNKVDAVTQLVERRVSGVAWFDRNHDGVRADDDPLLKDVTVTLVDRNGQTVKGMNGTPLTTTTDGKGYYELTGVPAGSGYALRFTPAKKGDWKGAKGATVKNAKEASEATDSDADQVMDGTTVSMLTIGLREFPAVKAMTSALYDDPNEDAGLWGEATAPFTGFPVQKTLTGRAFMTGDSFTFNATPLDGAPALEPATVTVTDGKATTLGAADLEPGTYKYRLTEAKGDNPAMTYGTDSYTATISVTLDGLTPVLSTVITRDKDGKTVDTATFDNTYEASGDLTLTGRKTLTGRAMTAGEFTFTVETLDGTTVSTASNKTDGTITWPVIHYTSETVAKAVKDGVAYRNTSGDAVYQYVAREDTAGLPAGVTQTGISTRFTVTVHDDGQGHLTATPSTGSTPITFTNQYSARSTSICLKGVKSLTADEGLRKPSITGRYTFTLTGDGDAPMPADTTASNRADGTVDFGDITYTQAMMGGEASKTFTYHVTESGKVAGVTNDKAQTVTVTVTDKGGRLEATVTRLDDGSLFRFENRFTVQPTTIALTASKILSGRDMKAGEFMFDLKDAGGATVDSRTNTTAKDGAMSTIRFKELTFSKPGTYTYTITERQGDLGGVTYDGASHTAVVTVVQDGAALTASVLYDGKATPPVFQNTYKPADTTVAPTARKTLTGRTLKDGEFAFTIKDGSGKTLSTGSNRADGTIAFTPITVTRDWLDRNGTRKGDTWTVNLTAVEDTSGLPAGVTATTATIPFTLTATDDNQGHLAATVGKNDLVGTFKNTYRAKDTSVDVTLTKTLKMADGLTGPDITGRFTFTLTAKEQDAPMPATTSASNDKDGGIRFGTITYTADSLNGKTTRTFHYTVTETGSLPGVTNDPKPREFTVTVTDDGQGHLTAVKTDTTPFVNTYAVSPATATVSGSKSLTGRDMTDGEFTFVLADPDGATIGTARSVAGKAGETTGFAFDPLTFDKPGDYAYVVTEQTGDLGGVDYDTRAFPLTVHVTDDGKGALKASVDYTDGATPAFTNTYTPAAVEATLAVSKTLTGRDMTAGERFRFTVTPDKTNPEDGATGVPATLSVGDLHDGDTADVDATLSFSKPGTYTYTVTEDKGDDTHMAYDATIRRVIYRVTDDGKGKLHVSVEYTDRLFDLPALGDRPTDGVIGDETAAAFTNTYTPDKTAPTPIIPQQVKQLAMTGMTTGILPALAALILVAGLGLSLSRRGRATHGRHGR